MKEHWTEHTEQDNHSTHKVVSCEMLPVTLYAFQNKATSTSRYPCEIGRNPLGLGPEYEYAMLCVKIGHPNSHIARYISGISQGSKKASGFAGFAQWLIPGDLEVPAAWFPPWYAAVLTWQRMLSNWLDCNSKFTGWFMEIQKTYYNLRL